jgi:hypothetical protein
MQTRDTPALLAWSLFYFSMPAGCIIRPPETEYVLTTTRNSRFWPVTLGPYQPGLRLKRSAPL